MLPTTNTKYCRIQSFYRKLSGMRLNHQFCIDIIKEFFCIENDVTVSKIISADLDPGTSFEHDDLDMIWIERRVQKHFKEQLKTTEE